MSWAKRINSSSSVMASTVPGTSGTPAACISCREPVLLPIDVMAEGGGPTQVRPASITAWANPAFSDRKP